MLQIGKSFEAERHQMVEPGSPAGVVAGVSVLAPAPGCPGSRRARVLFDVRGRFRWNHGLPGGIARLDAGLHIAGHDVQVLRVKVPYGLDELVFVQVLVEVPEFRRHIQFRGGKVNHPR